MHNHVCTDPFAIKAACDFVTGHGGKPLIAEGTKWPGGARGVFLQTGCESLLEGSGARLVDTITERPEQRMTVSPSRVWNEDFREIEVNRIFECVDVLLNIAKLKAHSNAVVTGHGEEYVRRAGAGPAPGGRPLLRRPALGPHLTREDGRGL